MPATRRKKPTVRGRVKPRHHKTRRMRRRGGRGHGGSMLNIASATDIPALEKALKKGPIVVGMFYLSWCGHCKKAEPSFKEVASQNHPGVNFVMVNSDLKDKTSLRNIQVNGVPDFFVSVPNKAGANSTIKPEMSYDKTSIERLATVASNAASLSSGEDPSTIVASLNNKSVKPPPFLAINAPSSKSNSLSVKPPSFKNLGKKAAVGAAALGAAALVAEEEEPINAVTEESTDSEDELMVPNYESTVNSRVSINANKRNSLITPAFSLGGEEPSVATTLSITSPIEATRSLTSSLPDSTLKAAANANKESLAEQEEAEGRNFSMIGGASVKKPKSPTINKSEIPVTVVLNKESKDFIQVRKTYENGESKVVKYIYKKTFTKQGEKKITSLEAKTQEDLINKIQKLINMGYKESL